MVEEKKALVPNSVKQYRRGAYRKVSKELGDVAAQVFNVFIRHFLPKLYSNKPDKRGRPSHYHQLLMPFTRPEYAMFLAIANERGKRHKGTVKDPFPLLKEIMRALVIEEYNRRFPGVDPDHFAEQFVLCPADKGDDYSWELDNRPKMKRLRTAWKKYQAELKDRKERHAARATRKPVKTYEEAKAEKDDQQAAEFAVTIRELEDTRIREAITQAENPPKKRRRFKSKKERSN